MNLSLTIYRGRSGWNVLVMHESNTVLNAVCGTEKEATETGLRAIINKSESILSLMGKNEVQKATEKGFNS